MATITTKTPAGCVFIFDNPRNRSHLFYRLLATHPQLISHYHPYVNAGCLGPDKIHYSIYENNPARTRLVRELWEPVCSDEFTFANSERKLLAAIAIIDKEGKRPLINEHCSYVTKHRILIDHILSREALDSATVDSNPTILPDALWQSITPIVVIRHPALAFPSLHRSTAGTPALANLDPTKNHNYWFATLAWSRLLFDTLQSQGRTPAVVDGEDVCTRTDEVIRGVCNALDLDPAGVSDTWVPLDETAGSFAHPIFKEMTRTIWESNGVKKHKSPGPVSIDDAVTSIEEDYGTEVAAKMRTAIEEQMENYRYREQFKV
ncbi:hypothetical protein ACHAPI_003394 [Fusarium lateritium]